MDSSHDRYKQLLMALLDGELAPAERAELETHLADCRECRAELDGFRRLKEVTDMVRFEEPDDAVWASYWHGIYNRLERGLGWILLSLGAIVLLAYGTFRLVEGLFADPTVALLVKVGVGAGLLGIVVLVVSLVRERLFGLRSDRYSREVRR